MQWLNERRETIFKLLGGSKKFHGFEIKILLLVGTLLIPPPVSHRNLAILECKQSESLILKGHKIT